MPVTVSFTLTRADVLRGFWVSLRSRPFALAQGIVFFIVFPWAVAVWQVVEAVSGATDVSTLSIVELALIPPLTVVVFGSIPLWISRGSRRIGSHHELEFTDEDIHFKGPGLESRVQWSALTKCFGMQHGVLFFSGNLPIVSIPGRTLTPEAASELRAMSAAKGIRVVGPWVGPR